MEERIILFIIDGLPVDIDKRIAMPNLTALKREGVSFNEVHLPLAAHPAYGKSYPWNCSLPNPVMMSGTAFIGEEGVDDHMIQHSFTQRPTAFYTNSWTYQSVSKGFMYYKDLSEHKNANLFKDELPINEAKQAILTLNPQFIKIHCQGPGSAGHLSQRELARPYTHNIWADGSPFIQQSQYVDTLLGEFVAWLKALDLWKNTILMVTGDHGQCDIGGHAPYQPGGCTTQMVIAGKNIKKGFHYEYAEVIDIAPTIAWLSQLPAPKFSVGRVLYEIALDQVDQQKVTPLMQMLNESLLLQAQLEVPLKGSLSIEEIGLWHTTSEGSNYPSFVQMQLSLINPYQK